MAGRAYWCSGRGDTCEQATGRSLPVRAPTADRHRRRAAADPADGAAARRSGLETAQPGDLGAALVGRTVLYWRPDNGWQRGTVARLCPRGSFSHVVAYIRRRRRCQHGGHAQATRRRLLRIPLGAFSPAPAAGVARAFRPWDPADSKFGGSPGPGGRFAYLVAARL